MYLTFFEIGTWWVVVFTAKNLTQQIERADDKLLKEQTCESEVEEVREEGEM